MIKTNSEYIGNNFFAPFVGSFISKLPVARNQFNHPSISWSILFSHLTNLFLILYIQLMSGYCIYVHICAYTSMQRGGKFFYHNHDLTNLPILKPYTKFR